MLSIDARGLSCPQPVLLAKEALLDHLKTLEVLVDNHTALENVCRFMEHHGYAVQKSEKQEDEYSIVAKNNFQTLTFTLRRS